MARTVKSVSYTHLDVYKRQVYKHYKKIVRDLNIPDARFHDLRHTYAVASLQAGDDVKTVQENLGHHTAAFTLDQYGHVTAVSYTHLDVYKRQEIHTIRQFEGLWFIVPH